VTSPPTVVAVVPTLNEETTVADVVARWPYPPHSMTIVDNGSTDRTAERARRAGATVVDEPRRGYGRACLSGVQANPNADVVVFIDADLSEDPADATSLVDHITRGEADLVLGRREEPDRPWHAGFGTALCVWLINRLWGSRYRDLGPFRAISGAALESLDMRDVTWGWTIEMQVKAIERGLRVIEVPVRSGSRAGGRSKISGNLVGSIRAGVRMLGIIAELRTTRAGRAASTER